MNALAAASAEMSASANASLAANLGLSAAVNAKLALMANLSASLKAMGMAGFNANAALMLGPLIGSLNMNLPTLPGGLGLMPQLDALGLLAAVMANLLKQWGINLAAPGGIAALQAKLDAIAAARASASANAAANLSAAANATAAANAAAAASAAASMSASAQASVFAAFAARLGLPLTPPDPFSQLIALVNALKAMGLPPITIPAASLSNVLGMFMGLLNINAGFGINLMASGSLSLLMNAVANINMSALANMNVAANMSASMAAAMNANANMALNAALNAKLDAILGPLDIGSLSPLAKLMALIQALKGLGIPLPTSPCQVCAFLKK